MPIENYKHAFGGDCGNGSESLSEVNMIILPHLLHVFLLNLITSFQLHNWDASRSVVKYTHSHLYNVNFTPSVAKQFNPIQSKFNAIILSENKVKQNNYCHCATICVCDTTENDVGSIYRPGRVRNGYSINK